MRFGVALVAVVLLAGSVPASGSVWLSYEADDGKWGLRYPAHFRLDRIAIDGRYSYRGASVSNFRAEIGGYPLTRLDVPPDGVLVRFWTSNGPPSFKFPSGGRETALPLSLASFERSPFPGTARVLPRLNAGGIVLGAAVWLGPRASERDRADLARVIASFRPRSLEAGWLDRRGLVLEREAAYPVGSVRRIEPSRVRHGFRPFYLVHGPGAFYTLSTSETMAAGPTPCDVRFDRRRFEFFCPDGIRWNRLGRRIPRRTSSERLSGHLVTVAYDGHVIVWMNTAGAGPPPDAWD